MKTAKSGVDARVSKVAGFTFDQVQAAVSEVLEEKYPTPEGEDRYCKGPWVRDIYDDKVVYSYEGQLFSIAYTFADGKASLSGEPTPVKVEYTPIGPGAATGEPPPPASPEAPAEAGKSVDGAALAKKVSDANEAREKLAKAGRVVWASDMSGVRKARVARKG